MVCIRAFILVKQLGNWMEILVRRNLGTKWVITVVNWIKMAVRYMKHYGKKGKTMLSHDTES